MVNSIYYDTNYAINFACRKYYSIFFEWLCECFLKMENDSAIMLIDIL